MKGKCIYYQSHQCDTKQMFGVFLYSTLNQRWRTGSLITLLDTYLSYVSLQTVLYCWVCQIFHEISEGACLIYVICVCLRIVVSKTYCVLLLFFFFLFVLCTLCCQFLWIVLFSLPLRYSLTFINIYSISDQNRASQMLLHWLLKGVVKQLWILKKV